MRNPRNDPAPGDVLMLPDGSEWRVVDAFISVDYETGNRRGLFLEITRDDAMRRTCLPLDRFRREMCGARTCAKALVVTDWGSVRRIAAPLVCAAMAAGHWPPAAGVDEN